MNDKPTDDVVGTIQLDGNSQRFYQGVASADEVLQAHKGTDFPTDQARRDMYWFYAGALAGGKHGCESVDDFSNFILGASTRAPLPEDDDHPEFEYALEYDDIPVGLFYEQAEQQLSTGGGAPSTMTDVKRLARTLRDNDAKVVAVHLLCPKCLNFGEIVLVDVDARWNRLDVEEGTATSPFDVEAGVIEGQKDYADDHYLCTARVGDTYCHTKLSAPSGFEHNWG